MKIPSSLFTTFFFILLFLIAIYLFIFLITLLLHKCNLYDYSRCKVVMLTAWNFQNELNVQFYYNRSQSHIDQINLSCCSIKEICVVNEEIPFSSFSSCGLFLPFSSKYGLSLPEEFSSFFWWYFTRRNRNIFEWNLRKYTQIYVIFSNIIFLISNYIQKLNCKHNTKKCNFYLFIYIVRQIWKKES